MARRRTRVVEDVAPVCGSQDQVVGARLVGILDELLRRLPNPHEHPNRSLLFSHVVAAHLLAFFNPVLRGLRSIEDLFEQPHVRKRFATPRIPRSTLADAQRLFDPALLLPIVRELLERVKVTAHDARLDTITRKLLAVDGTFFTVAPRIAWALFNGSGKGNVRAHVRFDVLRGVPESADLTDGQTSETGQLLQALEPNCFYLMDRGFQTYSLLAAILDVGSDFLVRLRKSAVAQVVAECPLSSADQAAGVIRDEIVQLGWREDQTTPLPRLRRVEVAFSQRDGSNGVMILLTNRLDLPAHLIALLYQHRWQVELFFRWLKCVTNFKHFFSESAEGMTLQVYVAIIGTLLIAVQTGAKPSRYDYALLSGVICGWSNLDEALEVAAKRRTERAQADVRQRAYNAKRAAKKSAQ